MYPLFGFPNDNTLQNYSTISKPGCWPWYSGDTEHSIYHHSLSCWTYLLGLVLFVFLCSRFLGIFYIQNHVICKYGQFYLFISDLYAVISFSCLIALARTSSIMSNKRVMGVDILVLILILRRKYAIILHHEGYR